MQIHIHRDGQQYGPYSLEQAREYLAAGNLLKSDLAWYDGAQDWVPLSQLTDLSPSVFQPAHETPSWVPARRDGQSPSPSTASSVPWAAPRSSTPALIPLPATSAPISPAPLPVLASVSAPAPTLTAIPISALSHGDADPDELPRIKPKDTRASRQMQQKQLVGKIYMMIGGLICLLGVVVTFGSMWAAESHVQGGPFMVAWGAILFGALGFVQGLRLYRNE
jgi:hypothetical protein